MTTMSHNRIVKRTKRYSKVKCDKCNKIKRMKNMATFKGKVLCSDCKPHIIGTKDKMIKIKHKLANVFPYGDVYVPDIEKDIEYLDEKFPKGKSKLRGEAMVLLALARLQGQKTNKDFLEFLSWIESHEKDIALKSMITKKIKEMGK